MRGARSNLLVAAWTTALLAASVSAPVNADPAFPELSHAAEVPAERSVLKSLLTIPADVLRTVTLSWWQADADDGEPATPSVTYPGFREAVRMNSVSPARSSYLFAKPSAYALRDADTWRSAISSALETETLVEAARQNRWEPFPTGFNNGVLPAATGNVGMRLNSGLQLSVAYETIDTSHRDAPLAARSSIGPVYEGPVLFATVEF